MTATNKLLYLPDTMNNWPWPRAINPHYKEVKAESDAWLKSLKPFTPESQYAFDRCDCALLASLANPSISQDHLRTACDLLNLLFVIDEYTDVESASVVREMVDTIMDAINNPHKPRPAGEIILGEAARQFWALAIKSATPESQKHFVEAFVDYLNSVVPEAEDRDNDTYRTIHSYLQNRRENIGVRPLCVMAELRAHIPNEVFYHPVLVELVYCTAELCTFDNDILSYNREQATNMARHNIITVAMRQFRIDVQTAIEWAAIYHREVQTQFFEGLKRLPSWGPDIDRQVQEYIHGLQQWPRANYCWSFERGRYFGHKGLEIQKTRCVPLLPKMKRNPELRGDQVIVPLVEL